jgi:hypothetical protein
MRGGDGRVSKDCRPRHAGAAPGIDEGGTCALQSEHQKRKRTMETGQPRFTDPDHVRETLCTGPCWTRLHERHDADRAYGHAPRRGHD